MKAVLLGPPGAGKGTQAKALCARYAMPHISTGDMLRAAVRDGSELGLQAKALLDAGHLVPDDLVVALVKERIAQPDCGNGFLLDGFPRTEPQAAALRDAGVTLDAVIEIRVPDEALVQRITGRRIHMPSGRIYHIHHNPPKTEGLDDHTGEALHQRDDDREATVRERLRTYHAQTAVVTDFYRRRMDADKLKFVTVDGTLPIDDVYQAILITLES